MADCDYERRRQERIAANRARMLSLGVDAAARSLASAAAAAAAAVAAPARPTSSTGSGASGGRAARRARSSEPSAPRRRSQRVAGQPAPSYDDSALDDVLEGTRRVRRRGAGGGEGRAPGPAARFVRGGPEQYDAEHVRSLAKPAETAWVLFVDGYGPDGKRVYDPARGETCHQCRQKTLGRHTSCSACGRLTGVFCGDCLWMRYGENVDASLADPSWRCPPCRDLCNCSFHRTARGWAPTGTLYRRALAEGFQSVAHYLVLNNLADDEARRAALELGGPEAFVREIRDELERSERRKESGEASEAEEEGGEGDEEKEHEIEASDGSGRERGGRDRLAPGPLSGGSCAPPRARAARRAGRRRSGADTESEASDSSDEESESESALERLLRGDGEASRDASAASSDPASSSAVTASDESSGASRTRRRAGARAPAASAASRLYAASEGSNDSITSDLSTVSERAKRAARRAGGRDARAAPAGPTSAEGTESDGSASIPSPPRSRTASPETKVGDGGAGAEPGARGAAKRAGAAGTKVAA